jgi:3'-5' exoribonuclease
MTVKELKEITKLNVPITGTFVISKCELKPFNNVNKGFFMQCLLTDLTGSLKGIVWEGAEAIRSWVKNKMVVDITGEITRYNDVPQVIIKTLKQKKDYNKADFLPSLSEDKIREYARVLYLNGENIKNDTCKSLWDMIVPTIAIIEGVPKYCFKTPLSEKFIQCPGGVGEVHHNYLGGLLEHVYGMVKTAMTLSEYSGLDRDLLITGCLLHDIGKIDAYNWQVILELTDTGRLLHHTTIGYNILRDISETIELHRPFTINDTLLKLAHIIISHHEDEGIRKPMFPEAQAVSALDAMDASVQHAIMYSNKAENQDLESNWTKFCNLTNRQYFVPKKIYDGLVQELIKEKNIVDIDSAF